MENQASNDNHRMNKHKMVQLHFMPICLLVENSQETYKNRKVSYKLILKKDPYPIFMSNEIPQ